VLLRLLLLDTTTTMAADGTCPNPGFTRGILSSNWADIMAVLTDGLSHQAASVVSGVFKVYLIMGALMAILAVWTAYRQFLWIMRPCLPLARERGYWVDRGPQDRSRYRMRWPTLSMLALTAGTCVLIAGLVMAALWPLWIPLFLPAMLWDRLSPLPPTTSASRAPAYDDDDDKVDEFPLPASKPPSCLCHCLSIVCYPITWLLGFVGAFFSDVVDQTLWRILRPYWRRIQTTVRNYEQEESDKARANHPPHKQYRSVKGNSPVPKEE
jgi:hypothetical protein